jgi:hypothetical protein
LRSFCFLNKRPSTRKQKALNKKTKGPQQENKGTSARKQMDLGKKTKGPQQENKRPSDFLLRALYFLA